MIAHLSNYLQPKTVSFGAPIKNAIIKGGDIDEFYKLNNITYYFCY